MKNIFCFNIGLNISIFNYWERENKIPFSHIIYYTNMLPNITNLPPGKKKNQHFYLLHPALYLFLFVWIFKLIAKPSLDSVANWDFLVSPFCGFRSSFEWIYVITQWRDLEMVFWMGKFQLWQILYIIMLMEH